jgi:CRISPR/Cas system CMR-associated protein Cmr5 small subunit
VLPKEEIQEVTQEALDNLEKIDNALPQVRGLESSDSEMDELAELAVDSFKDLKELGMQVDSRYSSEILSAASTFLGHAITAKTAKLNKKLRMIELQLKKAALDQKNEAANKELENTPMGEGKIIADRNELLKMLGQQAKDKDS